MKTYLGVAIAFMAIMCLFSGTDVMANPVYNSDWCYAVDANSDGSGGFLFEIFGIAVKNKDNSTYFAINANMPVEGVAWQGADDGNISWGDLIFNFTADDLMTASNKKELFAVKFTPNDSGVSEAGVYKEVSLKSVTGQNNGYDSLKSYYDAGYYREKTFGKDVDTKEKAYTHFYGKKVAEKPDKKNTPINNVMKKGTRVSDVTMLSVDELLAEYLDFATAGANGSETFGFKFDNDIFPKNSNYSASLFAECGNDGVVIYASNSSAVPELPGKAYPLLLVMGSAMIAGRKNIRRGK